MRETSLAPIVSSVRYPFRFLPQKSSLFSRIKEQNLQIKRDKLPLDPLLNFEFENDTIDNTVDKIVAQTKKLTVVINFFLEHNDGDSHVGSVRYFSVGNNILLLYH